MMASRYLFDAPPLLFFLLMFSNCYCVFLSLWLEWACWIDSTTSLLDVSTHRAPPQERACSFICLRPIKVSCESTVRSHVNVFLLSVRLLSKAAFSTSTTSFKIFMYCTFHTHTFHVLSFSEVVVEWRCYRRQLGATKPSSYIGSILKHMHRSILKHMHRRALCLEKNDSVIEDASDNTMILTDTWCCSDQ